MKKTHYFDDCDGIPWQAHAGHIPNVYRVSKDLRQCTCGQCKGRILNVLRSRDWDGLDDQAIRLLDELATEAESDD